MDNLVRLPGLLGHREPLVGACNGFQRPGDQGSSGLMSRLTLDVLTV